MRKFCAILVILSSAACLASPRYASPAVRTVVESSVRIAVSCGGEEEGYGSGTAVSDRLVVTAGHMIPSCADATYRVVFADGREAEVEFYRKAESVDLALLQALPGTFKTWAKVAKADVPIGDDVWVRGGHEVTHGDDGGSAWIKRGTANGYTFYAGGRGLRVSCHGVPGNSGGGIFNSRGELAGVLSAGNWDPGNENFVYAVAAGEIVTLLE